MHYLIYIPGDVSMTGNLQRVGLQDLGRACNGPDWRPMHANESPDKGVGMVGTWLLSNKRQPVDWDNLDRYEWTHSPPAEVDGVTYPKSAYWIGIHKQFKPGPGELIRDDLFAGFAVSLGDGNQWQIPSAYELPKTYGIDPETGNRTAKMETEHERYSVRAFQYASEFFSRAEEIAFLASMHKGVKLKETDIGLLSHLSTKDGPITRIEDVSPEDLQLSIPLDDGFDHACRALALHYRVNPFILGLLDVLDSKAITRICMASIDMPWIEEALKKNEPESPISLPVGSLI